MINALVPLNETMQVGKVIAESGYFSDSREAAQAVVKVLAGQELGFGPITSMMGIHIIKGKVTLAANLIASAIRKSGHYDYQVKELTAERCTITFFKGADVMGAETFTMEDAKRAQLAGGTNWQKWPKNMLFARTISNGAKFYCPDVFTTGVYTPDELGAAVDGETGEVITVEIEPPQPKSITELNKGEFFDRAKTAFDLTNALMGYILQSTDLVNGNGFEPRCAQKYWLTLQSVANFTDRVIKATPYYQNRIDVVQAMKENEIVYSIDDEPAHVEKLKAHAAAAADKAAQ